ncbi:MAG: LPS assembly lipoprotein LptE [Acidobacteriota bacterium]|nr:LPS assembly lipoprotein LptE [Acidobacteriota bacterium]
MRPCPKPAARSTPLRALALAALIPLLTGCGYHTAGSATRIPAGVHTLGVPVFATHAQAFHTELALTQAVVRELNTRTRYHIATQDSADNDATLAGTVLTQTAVPLTYDATTGQTSSYLLTITVKVVLTARDGRVLYQNDALSYREQYQSTQDLSGFIREDSPAIQRLARDFAQALVSDMLESF